MTIRTGERGSDQGPPFRKRSHEPVPDGRHLCRRYPALQPAAPVRRGWRARVETAPEVPDADVSLVKRDLAFVSVETNAPCLTDGDVLAILEEERRVFAEAGRRTSVPIPAQQMLSRTFDSRTPWAKPWAMRASSMRPSARSRCASCPRT